MTLAHTDAIDFAEDGNFGAWAWEDEEKNTAPVSSGMLTISDGMPSFDKLYLKDYSHVLSIANGVAKMETVTDFSEWITETFCNRTNELFVMKIRHHAIEPSSGVVRLERWGSRNFFHYYEQMAVCTEKNLFQTEADSMENCFYILQKLNGTVTLTMIYVDAPGKIVRNNSHSIEFRTEPEWGEMTVYARCAVMQSEEEKEKELRDFRKTVKKSSKEILEQQNAEWKNFWDRSFVSLPDEDYIENLYYSYQYLMNSCSMGKYPVTFGAIWCPNRDTRNWGHYYHWNQRISIHIIALGSATFPVYILPGYLD